MYDNRFTKLELGQTVVYNISGEVAKGRIVKLAEPVDTETKFGRRRLAKPVIHVELFHHAAGKTPGHISKVTNETNVLVLLEDDAPCSCIDRECVFCGQKRKVHKL